MAGNREWLQTVKDTLKLGRKTRKTYSLKDAMFDAKKIYRKGKNVVNNIGNNIGRRVRQTRQTRRHMNNRKGYKHRRTHRGGSPLTEKIQGGALPELSPADVNAK